MLRSTRGLAQGYSTLGPVRVRLSGVTRADEAGGAVASVTAPTVTEARAALDRAARVMGADSVLKASTDYRRQAIAQGLRVRVEVQAWGTAISHDEA